MLLSKDEKVWGDSTDMKLSRKEFEETVVSALEGLPTFFKKKMENIDVVVEDKAPHDLLSEMGLRSPFDLLGLYQGVPPGRRGINYSLVLPDNISIYREPIERLCEDTGADVSETVRRVVLHEIAHHFGIPDARLRELGY